MQQCISKQAPNTLTNVSKLDDVPVLHPFSSIELTNTFYERYILGKSASLVLGFSLT